MTKSKKKKRVKVFDQPLYTTDSHAVFRRSTEARRACFSVLHPDFESASGEAIRLVANSAAEHPDREHTMYVVKIEKVYRYVDGKFQ